jgi:hypothetical protein
MGLHAKPAWLDRIARAIGAPVVQPHAPQPDSPEPPAEPPDDPAPRRRPFWPLVAIVLGLLATLAWALALGWVVVRTLWMMLGLGS